MNARLTTPCVLVLLLSLTLYAVTTGCSQGDDDHDPPGDIYNVIEYEDPGGYYPITWRNYEQFFGAASAYADPITRGELEAQIDAVLNGEVECIDEPPADWDFENQLRRILNIGFLLDGINGRPLEVITVGRKQHGQYLEREVVLCDQYVGFFRALLFVPDADPPHPAILAFHGHGQSAESYIDEYDGGEFASRGWALMVVEFRADDWACIEHELAERLLLEGFMLKAIRIYEGLLALKYLNYLSEIDNERIGLIGHSGGSTTGNLLAALDVHIGAYVSDWHTDYCPNPGSYCTEDSLWDEHVPELYPLHRFINDFTYAGMPVLQVEYGYENGLDEVYDFFGETL